MSEFKFDFSGLIPVIIILLIFAPNVVDSATGWLFGQNCEKQECDCGNSSIITTTTILQEEDETIGGIASALQGSLIVLLIIFLVLGYAYMKHKKK